MHDAVTDILAQLMYCLLFIYLRKREINENLQSVFSFIYVLSATIIYLLTRRLIFVFQSCRPHSTEGRQHHSDPEHGARCRGDALVFSVASHYMFVLSQYQV